MINNQYFVNDTTELTAYSLEHYDEVKDIGDCHLIYKKTGKYYNKNKFGKRFIKAFQVFKLLNILLVSLLPQMPLKEEIMHTNLYDKVDEYNTLYYTHIFYKQEEFEETINDIYNILFDFETITSGEKHMSYLCWVYNDDIQQECVGINYCAVDMLNALPTDKQYILLIADNSDYDFIFIL